MLVPDSRVVWQYSVLEMIHIFPQKKKNWFTFTQSLVSYRSIRSSFLGTGRSQNKPFNLHKTKLTGVLCYLTYKPCYATRSPGAFASHKWSGSLNSPCCKVFGPFILSVKHLNIYFTSHHGFWFERMMAGPSFLTDLRCNVGSSPKECPMQNCGCGET